jgi:hypothetical protein
MDSSFREQGAGMQQQDPKKFFVPLLILARLIKWLVSLIKLTEEEQEQAGIYIDRMWDE